MTVNGEAQVGHDEDVQVEVGTLAEMGSLEAVESASISQQIATAKRFPRSVTRALREATELATLDEETAASCFYVLPRSGKKIEGPSARLAEIMAYSWGNLRVDADIVGEDRTHVTAMGTCFDLEKNVAVRVRVKRRITDKHGRRYNEDMIGVTSNAAISIALRNAVFKVVPQAFVRRIYEEARQASIGKAGTMAKKRQAALEWFSKAGVSDEQVFALLEVGGPDDIGVDELITLRGLVTALKDGETTVEQVFSPQRDSEQADSLDAALRKKGAKAGVEKAEPLKEEDDGSPATKSQLKQLQSLAEKAEESGQLSDGDRGEVDRVVREKDGPLVRSWVVEISKRLATAGSQGDLMDGEG